MHKQIIFIFLVFITLVFAGETKKLYRIGNPDRNLINRLERMGAVTSFYLPGRDAEVYLSAQQLEFVQFQKYKTYLIDDNILAKGVIDSISADHIIGSSYHNYEAVSFILDSLQSVYPDICTLLSIGQTVEGREIWALNISDNPGIDEAEPEVRYIANMHGDEIITQEVMLHFVEYLLQSYSSDTEITKLINHTDIWMIPNMNFDGTAILSRFNANGVDLNRNFPDREAGYVNPYPLQPETQVVMDWSAGHSFALAANFHAGALVANYPWDKNPDGSGGYAAAPDDAVFRRLALNYSIMNNDMYFSPVFENGITNGAEWYETSGSMQDWNYHFNSCMELTIEISNDKTPDVSQIIPVWLENKASMLNYIQQVHTGIHGQVMDSETGLPLAAQITVFGIDKTMHTDPDDGDYYRILEPGLYQIKFESEGYHPQMFSNILVAEDTSFALNISLEPVVYYEVSGIVLDSDSMDPIQNATIRFSQNNLLSDSAQTDMNGRFNLTIPEGEYHVSISHPDYFDLDTTLNILSDTELEYHLEQMLPGSISGIVNLTGTGSVSGTVVYVQGKTDTVLSDGFFEFNGIIPGRIHVFAYKFSYRTTHCDTVLQNGDSLTLHLDLWPGSNEYFTDFEDGFPVFEGTGDWEFGTLNTGALAKYFGNYTWATVLGGNYSDGIHQDFLETPIFSIQGFVIPQLEFYHTYDIEEYYDGGNVKVSVDEGKTWQLLRPSPDYPLQAISDEYRNPMAGEPAFSGKVDEWTQAKFDLSAYMGKPFLKFRFDFGTDEQKVAAGWYIDRFHIYDANATEIQKKTDNQLAVSELAVDIYPNPANPEASISFRNTTNSEVRVQIINITGQIIREEKFRAAGGEQYRWSWTGTNRTGRHVASGLYFVRISSDSQALVRKLVLIR